MEKSKSNSGFTLIEIVVVLIIISILSIIAIVNYEQSSEQTKAQTAENNLYAIAAAQEKYFEDYGTYCVAGCGSSPTNLSANLHVGLSGSDPFFANYSCTTASSPYICTTNDGIDTLNLTVTTTGSSVSCSGTNCP